jgi:hypothetical protein
MARRKLSGELGKKNQTDTGRVSQYTSPLQRNVSLFSQAIGSQANEIFSYSPMMPTFYIAESACCAIRWLRLWLHFTLKVVMIVYPLSRVR